MGLQHLNSHPVNAQPSRGSFGTHGAKVLKGAAAHPSGGKVGAKKGHKIVGTKMTSAMNKVHPQTNGGRAGAK
jgi:hypothetical protein